MNSFLDNIIDRAVGEDASDIYIQSESPVFLRINGRWPLFPVPEGTDGRRIERILRPPAPGRNSIQGVILSYARQVGSGHGKKTFRFRVNLCMTKKGVSIVMRRLKSVETNPLNLGVPGDLLRLVLESPAGGMILIAGPTGSGKSTTLASLIAYLVETRCINCVTIEDHQYDVPKGWATSSSGRWGPRRSPSSGR